MALGVNPLENDGTLHVGSLVVLANLPVHPAGRRGLRAEGKVFDRHRRRFPSADRLDRRHPLGAAAIDVGQTALLAVEARAGHDVPTASTPAGAATVWRWATWSPDGPPRSPPDPQTNSPRVGMSPSRAAFPASSGPQQGRLTGMVEVIAVRARAVAAIEDRRVQPTGHVIEEARWPPRSPRTSWPCDASLRRAAGRCGASALDRREVREAAVGVRAVEGEEVRELRHSDSLVSLEPLGAPPLPRSMPSRPRISNAGKLVSHRSKPVARTKVSICTFSPSAVMIPSGSIFTMDEVWSATFGLVNDAKYSLRRSDACNRSRSRASASRAARGRGLGA